MLEISILEIQINFLDDEPTILIIFYIKTLKHSFSLLVLKGLRVVQRIFIGHWKDALVVERESNWNCSSLTTVNIIFVLRLPASDFNGHTFFNNNKSRLCLIVLCLSI